MSLLGLAKKLRAEIERTQTVEVDYETIYLTLTTDAGTADDLAAVGRHVDFNGFWVAEELTWLDRRCDRLARDGAAEATYRAAILVLVSRIDELRRWHDGTVLASTLRRLNVVFNQPASGPVSLSDGTVVEHVPRFVGRLLTAVDYVLARPEVADAEAVLSTYLEQLGALGLQAGVKVAE